MIVRVDDKDLSDLIGKAFGKVSARDMSADDHELLARLKRTSRSGVHSAPDMDDDPGETREFDAMGTERPGFPRASHPPRPITDSPQA